jgi:RNA polymerase sigma-70 factor (ECF subfamily)
VATAGDGSLEFERIYRELYPQIVRTVFLVVFDRDIAQEIGHEAFLRFWQHQDKLAGSVNSRSWLMKVAVNLAIDHKRALLTALRKKFAATPTEDPADTALRHLQLDRMRKALRRLPARDRALLVLRFEQGLSFPEIGMMLDRPEATVKTWLHRALAALEKQMGDTDPGWLAEEA